MGVAEQVMETQTRMLEQVEAAQDRIVDMNRRVAEAVSGMMPKGERAMPTLPGMDAMPKPDEMIDRYFDFTTKLAEANRSFFKQMVDIWSAPEVAEDAKSEKAA